MTGLTTLHQQIRIWNKESALHFHVIRSKYLRVDSRHNIVFVKCTGAQKYGRRIVFGILFASGFGFFLWFSFMVPLALYLQQFGTRTCRFAWYLLHFWPCSPSILHGICHILTCQPLICIVFATFWYFKRSCGSLEGSLGFHLGCHLRFHLGFHLGFYLGLHVWFYLGCHVGFL